MHPPPHWSLCSFILALWLGSHRQPNVACAKHLQHRRVSFLILIRNSSSSLSLWSSTIYLARIYSLIRHSRNSISIPHFLPFPISTNISHSRVLASALAILTAFLAHIFGLQTHSFLNPALLGTHSFRPHTHTFPDSIHHLYRTFGACIFINTSYPYIPLLLLPMIKTIALRHHAPTHQFWSSLRAPFCPINSRHTRKGHKDWEAHAAIVIHGDNVLMHRNWELSKAFIGS